MSDWLARLRRRAAQPPSHPRAPLRLAMPDAEIGSIPPGLAHCMARAGLPLRKQGPAWWVEGDAHDALAALAHWLHAEGLAGRWRNEQLRVCDVDGRSVATIERAAVRPLGIATHAVHLVGRTVAGEVWVQQRALDKATDPGLWDTLMGGLMSADETPDETLERETWEEAGLRLEQIQPIQALGRITVRRPVREGYMVEHIRMYEALVPQGVQPVNQDGEVQRFERLDHDTLVQRLQADEFTLEAALILATALRLGVSA